jgi:hypothetical protein
MTVRFKTEWVSALLRILQWRYYGEYKYYIDFTFRELKGGEITSISLPLAFCIRHTLELGYKMNLIELEKASGQKATIKYQGKSAHKIDDLHREFESQMDTIFKKYSIDNEIKKQFRLLNEDLKKLKTQMHKLDELSYSFRYPVKNDGVAPNFAKQSNFSKNQSINFKEIKTLYDKSILLLTYTTDVIANEIGQ